MAATHPYISGAGNVAQMVNHLRKNFPATVTSETVKRLSIAPNNESYVINALQFVGIIDEEGKKTSSGGDVFSLHKDEEFQAKFGQLVKSSYSELFDLYGDDTWSLTKDDLIGFFRQADQTSATIGLRQANTFLVFSALSGHGELPTIKSTSKPKPKLKKSTKPKAAPKAKVSVPANAGDQNKAASNSPDIGVTVRIEINLPGDGSKETYDNIFKSIRENLFDA